MKRIIISILIGITLISCVKTENTVTFSNPLNVDFGDPYILNSSDGKFYMYGTTEKMNGFKVYSSDNLADWKDEGQIYTGDTDSS